MEITSSFAGDLSFFQFFRSDSGVPDKFFENMRGLKEWFSLDLKSFEISVEGEGRSLKGFIVERRKGVVSWVRFREEGLCILLEIIDLCCKEEGNT